MTQEVKQWLDRGIYLNAKGGGKLLSPLFNEGADHGELCLDASTLPVKLPLSSQDGDISLRDAGLYFQELMLSISDSNIHFNRGRMTENHAFPVIVNPALYPGSESFCQDAMQRFPEGILSLDSPAGTNSCNMKAKLTNGSSMLFQSYTMQFEAPIEILPELSDSLSVLLQDTRVLSEALVEVLSQGTKLSKNKAQILLGHKVLLKNGEDFCSKPALLPQKSGEFLAQPFNKLTVGHIFLYYIP